jgi:hypothetical protein
MESQNCWEFWNCPDEKKQTCDAYLTNSGKECFNFTKDFTPHVEKEFKKCWECPWYKKIKAEIEKDDKGEI